MAAAVAIRPNARVRTRFYCSENCVWFRRRFGWAADAKTTVFLEFIESVRRKNDTTVTIFSLCYLTVRVFFVFFLLDRRQLETGHAHPQPERTRRLWQHARSTDPQVGTERFRVQYTLHRWVVCPFLLCTSNNDWRPASFTSGETGLGKSTLMDSLFNTNFESTPSTHNLPNVKLKAHTYELQESNVQLKVDTQWFRVSLNTLYNVWTGHLTLLGILP